MRPLLSIIMPVYNQEAYLASTIESVLKQSFQSFEFLILDDGSTDKSSEIIQYYSNLDRRIRPFFQKNKGRCASINFLVDRACTDLCAFIDADDIMLINRLQTQYEFHLNNPKVTASSCHCYYIDNKGNIIGTQKYHNLKSIEDCDEALNRNDIVNCAITGLMLTKQSYFQVGGLRESFWPGDDMDFFNRYIEKKFHLVIIQEILMKYRIHISSITSSNLYFSYVDMYDYICITTRQRRSGENEIDFEIFKASRKTEPLLVKINRRRIFYGKIFHRDAGFALYKKEYFNFIYRLAFAFALLPKYVLTSLINRFRFVQI